MQQNYFLKNPLLLAIFIAGIQIVILFSGIAKYLFMYIGIGDLGTYYNPYVVGVTVDLYLIYFILILGLIISFILGSVYAHYFQEVISAQIRKKIKNYTLLIILLLIILFAPGLFQKHFESAGLAFFFIPLQMIFITLFIIVITMAYVILMSLMFKWGSDLYLYMRKRI